MNQWDLVYDYFEWVCNYQFEFDSEYDTKTPENEIGEIESDDFENTSGVEDFIEPTNARKNKGENES